MEDQTEKIPGELVFRNAFYGARTAQILQGR